MQTIRGLGRSPGHMLLGLALVLLVVAALCGGPGVIADDVTGDEGSPRSAHTRGDDTPSGDSDQ